MNHDFKSISIMRTEQVLETSFRALDIKKVMISAKKLGKKGDVTMAIEEIDFYVDLYEFCYLASFFQREVVLEEIKRQFETGAKNFVLFDSFKGKKEPSGPLSKRLTISYDWKKDGFSFVFKEGPGELFGKGIIKPKYEKPDKEMYFLLSKEEISKIFSAFDLYIREYLINSFIRQEIPTKDEEGREYEDYQLTSLGSQTSFLYFTTRSLELEKLALNIDSFEKNKGKAGRASFYFDLDELCFLREVLLSRLYEQDSKKVLDKKKRSLVTLFKGSGTEDIQSRIFTIMPNNKGSLDLTIRLGKGKRTDTGAVMPNYKSPEHTGFHRLSREKLIGLVDLAVRYLENYILVNSLFDQNEQRMLDLHFQKKERERRPALVQL